MGQKHCSSQQTKEDLLHLVVRRKVTYRLSLAGETISEARWEPCTLKLCKGSLNLYEHNRKLFQIDIASAPLSIHEDSLVFRLEQPQRIVAVRPDTKRDFGFFVEVVTNLKRPNWTQAPDCEICSTPFSVWKRVHHCRQCGKAVCAKCSPFKDRLPMLGYHKLKRVCIVCKQLPLRINGSRESHEDREGKRVTARFNQWSSMSFGGSGENKI